MSGSESRSAAAASCTLASYRSSQAASMLRRPGLVVPASYASPWNMGRVGGRSDASWDHRTWSA
eukprot:3426736-Prymnesium_polylepis.2